MFCIMTTVCIIIYRAQKNKLFMILVEGPMKNVRYFSMFFFVMSIATCAMDEGDLLERSKPKVTILRLPTTKKRSGSLVLGDYKTPRTAHNLSDNIHEKTTSSAPSTNRDFASKDIKKSSDEDRMIARFGLSPRNTKKLPSSDRSYHNPLSARPRLTSTYERDNYDSDIETDSQEDPCKVVNMIDIHKSEADLLRDRLEQLQKEEKHHKAKLAEIEKKRIKAIEKLLALVSCVTK